MCINKRKIRIKTALGYREMLVPCGHCPACMQAKAERRTQRIINQDRSSDGYIYLFVTLTYCNDCIPYIRRSDLENFKRSNDDSVDSVLLPVFRDSVDVSVPQYRLERESYTDYIEETNRKYKNHECNFRFVKTAAGYSRRKYGIKLLSDGLEIDAYTLNHTRIERKDLRGIRNGDPDKIGVVYYPDLQNFFKRLKENLKRVYNYEENIVYFGCAEYGPTTCRPHFHLLIECRPENYSLFKTAIVKSWSYDDNRVSRFVEIARNASSYVSSYVNCHNSISPLLRYGSFKPNHSYSLGFGMGKKVFSLPSILEKIRRGNLTYTQKISGQNSKGTSDDSITLLIPRYVLNRYFPKFKGFNRLTPDEVSDLIHRPRLVYTLPFRQKLGLIHDERAASRLGLSEGLTYEECHKIYVQLSNKTALARYISDSFNIDDYAHAYSRVWSLYDSQVLRFGLESFERMRLPWHDYFDNSSEFFEGYISSEGIVMTPSYQSDPNYKISNLSNHNRLIDKYLKYDKSRKLKNLEMAQLGLNV